MEEGKDLIKIEQQSKPVEIDNTVDKKQEAVPAKSSPFIHLIWAATLVAVIAILAVWVLPIMLTEKNVRDGAKEVQETVSKGVAAFTEAMQPKVSAQHIMSQTLGKIDKTKKLVVYTQTIDIEINKEESKRILSDYIPAGSASIRMKVLGNKVQFYVPLEEITEDSFQYDPRTKILSVNCPRVKIDKDMVSIQSDPGKIIIEEKSSWVPFGPKASDLLKSAQSELKDQAILTANNELVWNSAKIEAEKALKQFFSTLQSSMNDGTTLQIMLP